MGGIYLTSSERCLGYTVVHAQGEDVEKISEGTMDDEIKQLLRDGWTLVGGVSTFSWLEGNVRMFSFSQALVYIVED